MLTTSEILKRVRRIEIKDGRSKAVYHLAAVLNEQVLQFFWIKRSREMLKPVYPVVYVVAVKTPVAVGHGRQEHSPFLEDSA